MQGVRQCPVRGAQPQPPPQGRAGRGANLPPPQRAEHPAASPGVGEGRWGMWGRIRTRQDLGCGKLLYFALHFLPFQETNSWRGRSDLPAGKQPRPPRPPPLSILPGCSAPRGCLRLPEEPLLAQRSSHGPHGAVAAEPSLPPNPGSAHPTAPKLGGRSCLGVVEQPQPRRLGRLRSVALLLRAALVSPRAAVPRTEAEQLHPSPEPPAGCGPAHRG